MSDSLDLEFLATAGDEPVAGQQQLHKNLMRSIYAMFKCGFVHDTNNAALVAACERVAQLANALREEADAASLELPADGAYVNKSLIRLDPGTFDQADYLYALCSTLNVAA